MPKKLYLLTYGMHNSAANAAWYKKIDEIVASIPNIDLIKYNGKTSKIGQCRLILSHRDAYYVNGHLHKSLLNKSSLRLLSHIFVCQIPKNFRYGNPNAHARRFVVDLLNKHTF